MKTGRNYKFWFCTGSQDLYGDECLSHVAAHSKEIVEKLNASGNLPLDSYVNTVDEVERITGIDFFPTLPDEIEEKVEAEYDLKLW